VKPLREHRDYRRELTCNLADLKTALQNHSFEQNPTYVQSRSAVASGSTATKNPSSRFQSLEVHSMFSMPRREKSISCYQTAEMCLTQILHSLTSILRRWQNKLYDGRPTVSMCMDAYTPAPPIQKRPELPADDHYPLRMRRSIAFTDANNRMKLPLPPLVIARIPLL